MCVDLVDVNFPYHYLFGCRLFLFFTSIPYRCTAAFNSGFLLLVVHIAAPFVLLYNLVVKRNPLPPLFVIFLPKRILVRLFFIIKASPSYVTWKPFCCAYVTINKCVCRSGITVVPYNAARYIFPTHL